MLNIMFISLLISCVLHNFVCGQSDEVCLTLSRRGGADTQLPLAQGPPGRRGPQGERGQKGEAVVGPPGQCACNPSEIDELREQISELSESITSLNLWRHRITDKVVHCFVGMKDGRVRNDDITASTFWNNEHAPHFGRLDNQQQGGHIGAWAAGIDVPRQFARIGEWIQVDLESPTFVTGVVTQGRPTHSTQWVTSYKISYGNSTDQLQIMQREESDIIFHGNSDQNTKVTNMFPQPVVARYMRLIVQTWHGHPLLRLDYLTC